MLPGLRVAPVALLATLLLTACGGGDGGGGGTTPPPPTSTVSSVVIAQRDTMLAVGQTLALSATARDAKGATVSTTISWVTSDAGVARVDAQGVVTAVGPGLAIITATAAGVNARVAITVQAPIAAVEVTGPATSIGVGGAMQLTATLRDASGAVRTDRNVAWSTSDANVATVSTTGLVNAKAVGTAVISATTETITGKFTLTVTAARAPSITAVTPAELVPGGTVVITGSDFDPTLAGNSVSVGGVNATVTAATPTQVTARLATTYPCQATQAAAVRLATPAGAVTANAPLRVATRQDVTTGTLLTVSNPALFGCMELAGNGSRYLVAVVNASEVPSGAVAGITLRGLAQPAAGAAAVAGAAGVSASRLASPVIARVPRVAGPTVEAARQLASLRALEQSKAVLRRVRREVGAPKRLMRTGARTRAAKLRAASQRAVTTTAARGAVAGVAGGGTASAVAPLPTRIPTVVGDTTTVRLRSAQDCSTYTNIVARAVYVGTHSVVLEDTKAALARTMDADYAKLGREFDDVMFPILTRDFGDPLALDSLTNNDHRIAMLFTPEVNARSANLLGFVSACDFFPPDAAPWIGASNQAEIFYARAPVNATGGPVDVNSRDGWYRYMRSTLIHETKHIASFAERLLRTPDNAPDLILEESWLEEGTAQVAIELYARTIYGGLAWKNGATYQATLFCDWSFRYASCGSPPILMLDPFAFLSDYLANVDTKSFLSSGGEDNDIYGSAWLFARWAADTYASDEGAFFRALVTDWQRAGITNIRARTNASWESMLTNFMTSLWATGRAGVTPGANAQYVVPSWNLASIFAGLGSEGRGYAADPLRIQSTTGGAFTANIPRVAGGSASFVEIASPTALSGQILSLRDATGNAFGSATPLRLTVLRVQ